MIIAGLPNPKKFTARPLSRRVAWRYPQILREMNNLEGDEDVRNLIRKK
jgi:monofunctional biosynthetic peptidoglycan transglycosylase